MTCTLIVASASSLPPGPENSQKEAEGSTAGSSGRRGAEGEEEEAQESESRPLSHSASPRDLFGEGVSSGIEVERRGERERKERNRKSFL